uniref:Altered inheritance of mitochondria protein 21 n=1 Tax=Acrobeloides nanus TaxID=290746 RepID=A0A914BUP0_9BILA
MSKRWGLRPKKRSAETTSDDDKSDFEYETMLPLNDETEENENATNEKQEKLKKRQRKKAHFGLNLPIVVPGLLKGSFRKKPPKVEENIQSDTTTPFESSADDIDLTEIKLEEEERPEKAVQETPKSQQESRPKQVVIPIESDDNIEKAPLQTKEPILEDKTRPLTPEIIIVQKEPTTSKETTESQGPVKTTQTPEAPQGTQISEPFGGHKETEIPQETPEIPTEAMEIPQESPNDEQIPTTSRPRTKSSKTPSFQESPITDSQYSTDSLQAYSEPEMGMPDDSDPEFGAEPRQTLLAAIDSLLKDDLPDLSRSESAKKPKNEPVVDKPVEEDKSIEPEKPSAQLPSSENEPFADRATEEENLIKPEESKMETYQIPSPEPPTASEQDRPSFNDPLAQSYQDQPNADDSLTQPPGDVSGLKQEEAVETIDEPYNAPEQPVDQQESQDSSPILFDSGISDSKQPQHKVGLTPSTTTIPPESTPKLTDSGISEDKKLGQKDAPSTSSSITPMEASISESVTPMEASTPEPVTSMEASTPEPKIGEKATEISTPAKEPTEVPIPAVASAPPEIEQQPPSSSSREPSAAPTDPREHRSKSQSSSLYPPSDPRQQSDSEPEFVPDPGPSSSRQRQKRRSSTPDLPTRKEQSNSEAYPIDRVMVEPPEAILKIEDSDTNTTSSSSGTNVPKLVFGPESKSVQKEGIEKEKEEEKQTIV